MGHPSERPGGGRSNGVGQKERQVAGVGEGRSDDVQLERAVARAQEGSRDAMRYLYCRYAGAVYRYVRTILCDHHETEDVTQSVFAKLITRIGAYQNRGGVPFSAWLLRVARNAALDHLRERRPVPVDAVRRMEDQPAPEEDADAGAALHEAMAELTGEQRRVVFLRHVAGFTPPEIASRTGTTEAAVHGLHHRGRLALQHALEERGARPCVQDRHPLSVPRTTVQTTSPRPASY